MSGAAREGAPSGDHRTARSLRAAAPRDPWLRCCVQGRTPDFRYGALVLCRVALSTLVPAALDHRERRVPREPGIGRGASTQMEHAARGFDALRVAARETQSHLSRAGPGRSRIGHQSTVAMGRRVTTPAQSAAIRHAGSCADCHSRGCSHPARDRGKTAGFAADPPTRVHEPPRAIMNRGTSLA